jgi:hypothetical protein
MQEDGFDIPPWTAENLDRKDLLSMWKSITHALISTGHVAELHQKNWTTPAGLVVKI